MSYYNLGDSFHWFMARVVDINDEEKIGRVKIRIIHDQTGELGKKVSKFGIEDENLLWAYTISGIQSASLSWKKINELEYDNGEFVPDWIDAVGLSPTGIAVGTYCFGFYLDGHEGNIPLIFGTYHKISMYPEPGSDPQTMLQDLREPPTPNYRFYDIASLARGRYTDEERNIDVPGQTLPKEPYSVSKLWDDDPKKISPVDEMPTAYNTEYPYNTTYTTKSGHAIELDDTLSHERIHIWHQSGSYEEISNGPYNPAIDGDISPEVVADYPENGPAGWDYVTASGVSETSWIGRRVRKTMDSQFDITKKDKNILIERDQNISIANTETSKIGGSVHTTIGWQYAQAKDDVNPKRVNDTSSDYDAGGIAKGNYFLDIKNIKQQSVGNHYILSVGYAPKDERRPTKDGDNGGVKNYYRDVKQNTIITTFNNYVLGVGLQKENERILKDDDFGSYWLDVSGNHTTNVGLDLTVKARQKMMYEVTGPFEVESASMNLRAASMMNIESGTGIKIKAPGGVTVTEGSVLVEGALGSTSAASGAFTVWDGTIVEVTNGLITGILKA